MARRFAGLTLMVIFLMTGFTADPYFHRRGAEDAEVLIIDLSRKAPENPYQTEYERMLYPTVRVKTANSTGSGVIINTNEHEYILTAAHVVGNQSEVTVEIYSSITSSQCLRASVVITDTAKDLALLTTNGHELTRIYSATLAPKNYTPYLFSPVWAVGCSLGLHPRPSYGHLCALSVSAVNWEISAPILPGNSGGPVYATVPSDDGNGSTYAVIGIAIWVHTYKGQLVTTMAGIVPINEIYEFLEKVPREYAGSKSL